MISDQTGEYPWDLVKKAWSLGLINNHIPASIGGTDLSCLTCCIIGEEMAWGCTGITTALEGTGKTTGFSLDHQLNRHLFQDLDKRL